MEIGKQIKKYRSEMEVSQEELAERIFVSRQTVSNWENEKNYPDLKSLLLLSSLLGVSLDILVKGDIEQMKEEIKSEDIKYVKRSNRIYYTLLLSTILSTLLVAIYILWMVEFATITVSTFTFVVITSTVSGIMVLLAALTVFFYYRVTKLRKKFDIMSYKEIVAFYEGKTLNEIDKQRAREESHPYKKRLYATYFLTALLTVFMLSTVVLFIFRVFSYIFA